MNLSNLISTLALSWALVSTGAAEPLPAAAPESVGISPERLGRMHRVVREYVDQKKHGGIITLLARDGRVIDSKSWGYRDIEAGAPMTTDTICRIYSMSKIVTSVAALMLFEEGLLALTDPVERYLPRLANRSVWAGGTAGNPILGEAKKPITIKELLTHTSGFTYGFLGEEPIHEIYRRADLWESGSLEEFIEKVASLPLQHQPGEGWTYGISLDVLGGVIQAAAGQPFDRFLEERIFRPLQMRDTAFFVPEEKRSRLAATYQHSPDGTLERAEPMLGVFQEKGRGFPSGGGGLFSTTADFARFAQMLLNGGELDGARLLGRKTIELMRVNHIAHLPDPTITWSEADGFGLGGAVRIDLAKGNNLGSIGQFGWYGAATTYCNIDFEERIVALLFTQHFPFNEHEIFERFGTAYYQALTQ